MKSASGDKDTGRSTGEIPSPETAAKSKPVGPEIGSLMTNGVALSISAIVVF